MQFVATGVDSPTYMLTHVTKLEFLDVANLAHELLRGKGESKRVLFFTPHRG